jgi:hypothetical protein
MRVEDCVFEGNGGHGYGGAVVVFRSTDLVFERCVIADNRGMTGAWIFGFPEPSSCALVNCTVANNPDYFEGGGGLVVGAGASVTLERTVVWGECSGIEVDSAGSVLSICSLVDTTRVTGTGQIDYSGPSIFQDPLFCNPRGCTWPPEQHGDYRVEAQSPCLPANNPCGVLIGVRDVCTTTGIPWGEEPSGAWVSAFPNPFRGSTTFALGGLVQREATLTVFDSSGRRIRVFEITGASERLSWDGTDESGRRVGPGTYFLRAVSASSHSLGRVTLIR